MIDDAGGTFAVWYWPVGPLICIGGSMGWQRSSRINTARILLRKESSSSSAGSCLGPGWHRKSPTLPGDGAESPRSPDQWSQLFENILTFCAKQRNFLAGRIAMSWSMESHSKKPTAFLPGEVGSLLLKNSGTTGSVRYPTVYTEGRIRLFQNAVLWSGHSVSRGKGTENCCMDPFHTYPR